MKPFFLTLFLFAGLAFSYDASAINNTATIAPSVLASNSQMTVNDFLAIDLKKANNRSGQKISWAQRLVLKQYQKGLDRKVQKGKLDGTMTLSEATRAGNANMTGLLSLIFSAVGLILLWTPLGLIGMALGIAGFVLGIIGLKKDANTTMALIGTILGALVIFMTLLAVIIVASWLSF